MTRPISFRSSVQSLALNPPVSARALAQEFGLQPPTSLEQILSAIPLDFNFPDVTFSGGVPIGGNAIVKLYPNGNYQFTGHMHKSSIVPYDYNIAIGIRDHAGRAYTFSHQYSFGGGVADDDFPYSGNNPDVAANWPDLLAGANSSLSGSAGPDIDEILKLLENLISDIAAAYGAVSKVIAVVGPLLA
jgi:hypothetical protein